ncbi:MAG: TIGR03013 family PEP-CTERM/XrtA system glycosyltransferase [Desulfamplus sp.]|nr:TIGR03013 family PEP-CTERM/XrtA system glycosyltransferase [Desulfamplus sp.]
MLNILKQYYPIRNIIFFMIEGAVIFFSVLLALVIFTYSNSFLFDLFIILRISVVTVVCQISLYYNDLYDFEVASTVSEMIIRLMQSLGVTSIALAVIYFYFPMVIIDEVIFALSIFLLLVFVVAWRLIYISILNKGMFNESIVILGSSRLASDILNEIDTHLDCGYTVMAVIPDSIHGHVNNNSEPVNKRIADRELINVDKTEFCDAVINMGVRKVVEALQDKRSFFPAEELLKCRVAGVDVIEGTTFYEMLTGKLPVTFINPSWLIFSSGFRKSGFKAFIKRLIDIVASLILIVLLLPLLLITAFLIKIDSKGQILFAQDRVGQNKKEYMMYKFRSMKQNAEKTSGPVWAKDNDDRITRVGRVIRKFRIDELPQLWNVLTGTMSMVGPRPERKHFTDQLEKAIPYYSERFTVKPGITGWAQVCYDYGASVEDAIEKLNYDLFYIKNMSIMMDVVIILRTIKTVLFGRGAR